MDRNSAIGLTLIAVLLLVYFNFFAPEPPKEPATTNSISTPSDSTRQPGTPADSSSVMQPSRPAAPAPIDEKLTRIETADFNFTFTNHGGVIREVELRNFKTYYKKPLQLVAPTFNSFALNATLEGRIVNLYGLYYNMESRTLGDSTILTYSASISEGREIRHIYSIPNRGYLIRYRIESKGLDTILSGDQLTLGWTDFIPSQEKDIRDSRAKTTINYYTAAGDFDGLSETSQDPESETLTEPIKWVAIRQKFFTSSIIADNAFSGARIATQVNQADSLVVKSAEVGLSISRGDILSNKARFTFFFGPNDYKVLTPVANDFSRNLYLGWPPVIWVNKFVIIPIFHFLERYISNYGIIIMILVLIIKLVLTPLSYSSYLGMAKMRLLKPELDLIKEKNGDNMTQTQQDQMKLYQQAGVNPFSGCIPLLLQMPILFAMFYFFPVSVELRQKPFLWADDLSTYDSIMNLPFTIPFYGNHVSLFVLLMTASTLIYTWQNNQLTSVTGPMKSMSLIMPVIFMFVLNSFSAGLSFYYFVSNLVTFAQQAIIKRFVDEGKILAVMDDHKKKMATGTGKKSKFMTKLDEAMKASEEARKKKN